MTDGTTEEFTAGEQRTIPFGQTEADRSSGWRDAAFVVITKARKGPSKEDDFALDADGHLIFCNPRHPREERHRSTCQRLRPRAYPVTKCGP